MSFQIELQDQSARPTLSMRVRTSVDKLPQQFGRVYGAIMQHLGGVRQYPTGAPYAAYYNMDMQNLDVEIGFPVAKGVPGTDVILQGELPAGQAVTCLYTGPYSEINVPYEAVAEWIQKNGYETTGVSYEFYLNDPETTPPQKLQTQIVFPLKQ